MDILAQTLQGFDLSDPIEIAETGIATVWKVTQANGTLAALKIYKGLDEKDEGPGYRVLAAWQDAAAAQVIAHSPGIALLEWLDGETLADMSHSGADAKANAILVEVAARCHAVPVNDLTGFQTLRDKFADLFALTLVDDCPPDVRSAMTACQSLANQLLETQPKQRLLHGDLHHENVIHGSRGWCVIDAKGIVGDPAYELANAFRNPLGNDEIIRDPARTQSLATQWARACGCSPRRALEWAAAHAAVSMAWALDGSLGVFPDSDLPGFYLRQAAVADP